jgi:NADH-quinone oxidoreductase subunit D
MAVEKLLDITKEIPERAQYIRVLVGEVSRITDHLTCLGASAMELGAFTVFLYALKAREWLFELLEEVCGARLTSTYLRIGGVAYDLPPSFDAKLRAILERTQIVLSDISKLLDRNRIFRDRMDGIGIITKEDAISWGITGPVGRSTGLAFDVPIGSTGDNFDRYAVRVEEIHQSIRIIDQALKQIPPGPFMHGDPRIALPPKTEVYNSIEGMIAHFKIIMDGIHVPSGEVYSFTEAGNGELGFYLVSDGTGRPWKCRVRPPCFPATAVLTKVLPGLFIADVVPTFGMINMIGGECDR